jgi:hypothetical protein
MSQNILPNRWLRRNETIFLQPTFGSSLSRLHEQNRADRSSEETDGKSSPRPSSSSAADSYSTTDQAAPAAALCAAQDYWRMKRNENLLPEQRHHTSKNHRTSNFITG